MDIVENGSTTSSCSCTRGRRLPKRCSLRRRRGRGAERRNHRHGVGNWYLYNGPEAEAECLPPCDRGREGSGPRSRTWRRKPSPAGSAGVSARVRGESAPSARARPGDAWAGSLIHSGRRSSLPNSGHAGDPTDRSDRDATRGESRDAHGGMRLLIRIPPRERRAGLGSRSGLHPPTRLESRPPTPRHPSVRCRPGGSHRYRRRATRSDNGHRRRRRLHRLVRRLGSRGNVFHDSSSARAGVTSATAAGRRVGWRFCAWRASER